MAYFMIPKIIHYCWFGGKEIPAELQNYINNWKTYCPDYEIMLWNEDNFDINAYSFTQSAYNEKKYAYVSDYVRAYALYNHGGIYLDTDVEIKESLDEFLLHDAFSGFECLGSPFTAVWGAKPKHALCKLALDFYQDRIYNKNENTNTFEISQFLINKFNINPNHNYLQLGEYQGDTIHIYPSYTFCLDLPKNYTTHHFYGSWLPQNKNYKKITHCSYIEELIYENYQELNTKRLLKTIASNISIKQFLSFIRYFIGYKFLGKKN